METAKQCSAKTVQQRQGDYILTWKLEISTTKTLTLIFHLNNTEDKSELNVTFNNETLLFCI